MKENKNYEEFLKYNNSIIEYEQIIDSFNNSKEEMEDEGYLVDHEDFCELKILLNYKQYKELKQQNKTHRFRSLFNEKNFNKIKKLKPIESKSADYVKNIILKINCVLVTPEIYD